MAQKIYIVEGRQFRTAAEYNRAMHDKKIIDKMKGFLWKLKKNKNSNY